MTRLFLAFALIAFTATGVQAKLYRWVDEKGRVQYSDQPPVGKPVSEMDEGGRIRKAPEKPLTSEERAKQQEEERQRIARDRRDRALLQTYTKAEEFDQRALLQIEAVQAQITSNQLRRNTAVDRSNKLQEQVKKLQSRQRPVPADLQEDIAIVRNEISDIDGLIARHMQEISDIRSRTEADKQRWKELKSKQ